MNKKIDEARLRDKINNSKDHLDCWLKENCDIGDIRIKTSSNIIYQNYFNWCSTKDIPPYSTTKFGMDMGKRFEKIKYGTISYIGIKLKNT